jgi:O-antigen/teichoic acid export membrane protein
VAFTLLQSQGRPDVTGKLHAIEVLPFLAILWILTTTFGINGAAIAWSLRCAVDAFAMFWAAGIPRRDVLASSRPAGLLGASGLAAYFVSPKLAFAIPSAIVAGLLALALAYAYCEECRSLVASVWRRDLGDGLLRRGRPPKLIRPQE